MPCILNVPPSPPLFLCFPCLQGCVEVLSHGDPGHEHSFGQWGLSLKVSFREGQAMVPLKKSVQSVRGPTRLG